MVIDSNKCSNLRKILCKIGFHKIKQVAPMKVLVTPEKNFKAGKILGFFAWGECECCPYEGFKRGSGDFYFTDEDTMTVKEYKTYYHI